MKYFIYKKFLIIINNLLFSLTSSSNPLSSIISVIDEGPIFVYFYKNYKVLINFYLH